MPPSGTADELLALLDAWRETPASDLADEIEIVSKSVEVAPLAGKTIVQRDESFEARVVAKDPLDLPILLSHALARRNSAMVPSRLLVLLAKFPRDPRTTKPLVEALAYPHWSSGTAHGFWDAVFDALAHHADPRSRDMLEPLGFTQFWDAGTARLTKKRDKLLAKLPVAPIVTPRSKPPKPVAVQSIERLVAGVLAEPTRAELRDVLRDALLEANDPRGEHMALDAIARTRPLTAEELGRQHELFDDAWLGPLASFAILPRIRDGFLVACGFSNERATQIIASIDAPQWRTVERLDTFYWQRALPLQLFARMPVLRALACVVVETLGPVWSRETAWLSALGIMHLVEREWRPLLDADDRPPNITRLETSASYDRTRDYPWLWETAAFRGLSELAVALGNSSLAEWYATVSAKTHAHLRVIELGRYRFTGALRTLTVELPPTTRERPTANQIAKVLATVPAKSISSVRFTGRALDGKQRAIFEKALANQALDAFDAHVQT